MENNLENKAKFFAQYWGQEVLISPNVIQGKLIKITYDIMVHVESNEYLQLKPLSSITDAEADELGFENAKNFQEVTNYGKKLFPIDVDGLRRLGFAVGYYDLSVEKLLRFGWIKLAE